MEKTIIYPGTFDPVTYGHLDIIGRAVAIYDHLVVAVAHNPQKNPLFSVEERKEMLRLSIGDNLNVVIEDFNRLLIDYLRRRGTRVVLRGLRALSDFDYEFQMALTNRKQDNTIETIFMMTGEAYSYLSSKLIKEIASLGGTVDGLVPPPVAEKLKAKFKEGGSG